MPRFLFWNIHNNERIGASVVKLAAYWDVDVLLLAEVPANLRAAGLLPHLNAADPTRYQRLSSGTCLKIEGYVSRRCRAAHIASATDYILFNLESGAGRLLIAAAHFSSKMYEEEYEQRRRAERLAEAIQSAEDSPNVQHQNTLAIGDFNMNPFERGMVAANGLHAVMSRQIAQGRRDTPNARVVGGREYRLFYNPAWSQMGERDGACIGSYYYDKSQPVTYFWNWFDQALIRPALLPRFQDANYRILTGIPETTAAGAAGRELLTDAGLPNAKDFSDHLPIFVSLDDLAGE